MSNNKDEKSKNENDYVRVVSVIIIMQKFRFLSKNDILKIKILHLSNAYQKSNNKKSMNVCEDKNVLIKRKCFEMHAIDYKTLT